MVKVFKILFFRLVNNFQEFKIQTIYRIVSNATEENECIHLPCFFFFLIWTEYRTPYGSKLSALVNICNGDSEGLKSIMH